MDDARERALEFLDEARGQFAGGVFEGGFGGGLFGDVGDDAGLAIGEKDGAIAAAAGGEFDAAFAGEEAGFAGGERAEGFAGYFDVGFGVGFFVNDGEADRFEDVAEFGLAGGIGSAGAEVNFGDGDGDFRGAIFLVVSDEFLEVVVAIGEGGGEIGLFGGEGFGNFVAEGGGEFAEGEGFGRFAEDAAGFGAHDFGDSGDVFVEFEDAAGDEDFGAGELADFGGGVGGDCAGGAELLFAEDFVEFGAFDGDDVVGGGKGGLKEGADFGSGVAEGFFFGFEIENGDGERLLRSGGAGGDRKREQCQRQRKKPFHMLG